MKRFLIALLLFPAFALAFTSPGKPTGFVNDFAGVLSEETKILLEKILTDFERQSGNEISLVTIESYGRDETIETYAVKLFEEWGIGKEDVDNGLLLLIARDDREMRIEVGYGLEPIITDIESSHIISDVLVPNFRENNFDTGVKLALERIILDIQNGEPFYTEPAISYGFLSQSFYLFIFFILFLASVLGRSKSWWAGGVIGAIVGVIIGGIFAIVGLSLIGLLFDFFVSRVHARHKSSGTLPPWWLGGGGRGGSGGFGGFGGGMSGGGGSSGRW